MPQKPGPQNAHGKTGQEQQRRAPGGRGRDPLERNKRPNLSAQPSAFLFLIQRIFQACAATRQQSCIGFHVARRKQREQLIFPRQRRVAFRAVQQMVVHLCDFRRVQLAGGKEHDARFKFAAHPARRHISFVLLHSVRPRCLAYRMPSRLARNFRVARNSEFFTVSSEVPSISPMARSFNP